MSEVYTVIPQNRISHRVLRKTSGTIGGLLEAALEDPQVTDFYGNCFHVMLPIEFRAENFKIIVDDLTHKFRAVEMLIELGITRTETTSELVVSSLTNITNREFANLTALVTLHNQDKNSEAFTHTRDDMFPSGLQDFANTHFSEYDPFEGLEEAQGSL